MKIKRDLLGQRFGRLRVIKLASPDPITRNRQWKVVCDCGSLRVVWESALIRSHIKSCGCLHRFQNGEYAKNSVIGSYKRGATKRGLCWELSREHALTLMAEECFFCKSFPANVFSAQSGDFVYNGIDRLDNGFGYTFENSVACCRICNFMKRSMGTKEFLTHIRKIIDNFVEEPVEKT